MTVQEEQVLRRRAWSGTQQGVQVIKKRLQRGALFQSKDSNFFKIITLKCLDLIMERRDRRTNNSRLCFRSHLTVQGARKAEAQPF